MNRLYYILLIILIPVCLPLSATDDIHIFGHVVDRNGNHIPFANVLVSGTTIGAACDMTGHYMITGIEPGKYILVARAVGYVQEEIEINIGPGESQEVNFTLREDYIGIEQVVISANRNEINRRDAAVIVNAVTPRVFQLSQAVTLADGLKFTPGLRVENNCQNCGFIQLRMNGLPGPYTQVLVNSRPVFSGLAGVYGLEQIPESMVERVEIVRGGGSAIFGGNAIGGTVNIITRDPVRNGFTLNSNFGLNGFPLDAGNGPTPDAGLGFNASVVSDDLATGLYVYAHSRKRDGYDANDDGFTEFPLLESNSAGFRAFYRPGITSRISLDFYTIQEDRRGGNKLESMPHETDITEQADSRIYGGGLSYEVYTSQERKNKFSAYYSMQSVDRGSYYGALQDPSAYGQTDDLVMVTGLQFAVYNEDLLLIPKRTTMGIENNFGLLKDSKLGYYDPVDQIHYDNTLLTHQSSNTIGGYVQGEWDLLKNLILLAGIRMDYYHIIQMEDQDVLNANLVFSPRLNLLYNINSKIQGRLSFSTGYRAPQIFNEDLHILSSGARRIIHANDPDLSQENSISLSGSFDYTSTLGNGIQLYLLAEGFYTRLLNSFANEFAWADSTSKDIIHYRTNVEGARVYGTNLEFKIAPSSSLLFQGGFTLQKSSYDVPVQWGEDETHTSGHFLRAPARYGYFIASWTTGSHLSLSATGTYTGPMEVPHFPGAENNPETGEILVNSPDLLELGIRMAFDFRLAGGITLQLNCGMQNILNAYQDDFDIGVNRDAGYIYGPLAPRGIFVGLKLGNLWGSSIAKHEGMGAPKNQNPLRIRKRSFNRKRRGRGD